MTLGDQARTFRQVFNQEILENISHYGFIKKNLFEMQTELIREEAREFLDAALALQEDPEDGPKREELCKELSDLVFVCYQFAAAFNIDLDKAMTLVFESNMSKLDDNGMPIYREDGKVLKGPNYKKPNLTSCIPAPAKNRYDTHGK
jgi:NTP pyrophosphatase (non-canonical NTP hydrolase)